MSKAGTGNYTAGQETSAAKRLAQRAREIKTAPEFARFMTDVMAAVIEGELNAVTAQSICASAQVMLKAIEMQLKFNRCAGAGLVLTEAPSLLALPQKTETAKSARVAVGKKWCYECYIQSKQYITATEDDDGDPLCLSCYNERNGHLK